MLPEIRHGYILIAADYLVDVNPKRYSYKILKKKEDPGFALRVLFDSFDKTVFNLSTGNTLKLEKREGKMPTTWYFD